MWTKLKQFWKWIIFSLFGVGVVYASTLGGQTLAECKSDQTKSVSERITTCPVPKNERASFKGKEIAKLSLGNDWTKIGDYELQFPYPIKSINNGVEVLARVRYYDTKEQIGFGKDGSVDIERFIFTNPPILVRDENGDIVRTGTNSKGEEVTTKYREDTQEAILQALGRTISKKQYKFDSSNIIAGKVGNTTTTVYPDASTGSTTVDGTVADDYTQEGLGWSAVRDAVTGVSHNDTGADVFILVNESGGAGPDAYNIHRYFASVDASAVPDGETIDSITWTLFATAKGDADNDGQDYINVYGSTFATDNDLVNADFDAIGSTAYATAVDIGDIVVTPDTDQDWVFNATGIAAFVDGIFKIGMREGHDAEDAPLAQNGTNSLDFKAADEAGTTDDPTMVIESSVAATFQQQVIEIY